MLGYHRQADVLWICTYINLTSMIENCAHKSILHPYKCQCLNNIGKKSFANNFVSLSELFANDYNSERLTKLCLYPLIKNCVYLLFYLLCVPIIVVFVYLTLFCYIAVK